MTYKEALEKVAHLKAIGETSIWLPDKSEKPWEYVTKCEPGGSHRLDIDTSVWFEAVEPKTQLHFRWSFDIEPYSANGKGSYEIDADSCRDVLQRLKGNSRKIFKDYLSACAFKVREKAHEWDAITQRQFNDAKILLELSQT